MIKQNNDIDRLLHAMLDWNHHVFIMLFLFLAYKIWALQDGTTVIVGGKTNRAKAEFPDEMNRLLDQVPEIVESSISKKPDNIGG